MKKPKPQPGSISLNFPPGFLEKMVAAQEATKAKFDANEEEIMKAFHGDGDFGAVIEKIFKPDAKP